MLHIASTQYCDNINDTMFLQGCYGQYCIKYSCDIVPYYALQHMLEISRRQDHKSAHLSLKLFGIDATVQDETFVTTLSKVTIFVLNSKLEFHTKNIISNSLFVSPTFTSFFSYSWTILVHTQCSVYYLN